MTYFRADPTVGKPATVAGAPTAGENLNPLADIHKYPMLEQDEELELIARWHRDSDQIALEKLITSHLRLVAKIANGFRRYGVQIEDLISEGTIGLIKAIDRFDPEKGFRLATYAKWWIRAGMQEYIMRSWSLVRVGTTLGQKRLFFNLRQMKIELCGGQEAQLSPEDRDTIISRLDVSESDLDIMDARMTRQDCSLNELVSDGETMEWQDWLVDEGENQEEIYAAEEQAEADRKMIAAALEKFPERDRQIFIMRRISEEKPTLAELSKRFNISPERVRQIEHAVFASLCETLGSPAEEAAA